MRRPNPFQTDPVWAQATDNLAQIIQGNPAEQAQIEAGLTQARSQQQQDRFARQNRQHMSEAADALDTGDMQGFITNATRTNNPDMLQRVPETLQAHGGVSLADGVFNEDQMMALMAGAGNAGDPDTALSMDHQNQISGRNAGEDRALARTEARADMMNPTDMEGVAARGTATGDMGIDEAVLALGADDRALAETEAQVDAMNPTDLDGVFALEAMRGNMTPGEAAFQSERGQMDVGNVVSDMIVRGRVDPRTGRNMVDGPRDPREQVARMMEGADDPFSMLQAFEMAQNPGQGPSGMTPYEEMEQVQQLETQIADETAAKLTEYNLPTDDEGNLNMAELGPAGSNLFSQVSDAALMRARQDASDPQAQVRSTGHYVEQALQEAGLRMSPGTEDGWVRDGLDDEYFVRGGEEDTMVNLRTGETVPKTGAVVDGYRYVGGLRDDPGDERNWRRVGPRPNVGQSGVPSGPGQSGVPSGPMGGHNLLEVPDI